VVNSEVKHQRNCGAYWIFTATAAIESARALGKLRKREKSRKKLHKPHITSLSEAMIDCLDGCAGGWSEKAMKYASKHGLVRKEDCEFRGKVS